MNGLQHAGAFVIQFRAGTDFESGRVGGRLEHIASGRTACFESADQLLTLLARILREAVQTTEEQNRSWDGDMQG